jgi:predicted AAA+ superfamily ATPase
MVNKMEWYEELDFDENPFDTNPKRFADRLVGVNEVLDELFYRIHAGSMVFIEAKKGYGKTALLWNVIKKFKGKGKIIYVDCQAIEEELNIEDLLIKKYGPIKRLLKKKPTNMILLLDNVTHLSETNSERVKYYFDQGYIKSVVFTGISFSSVKFSPSLIQRIGTRKLKLVELDSYQAIALVRNRIEDLEMISDELIEEIFELSKKNPKLLLENCEKIFSSAIESNDDKITKKHLKKIEG